VGIYFAGDAAENTLVNDVTPIASSFFKPEDKPKAADGGKLFSGAIDSFAQTFSALALAVLAVSSF